MANPRASGAVAAVAALSVLIHHLLDLLLEVLHRRIGTLLAFKQGVKRAGHRRLDLGRSGEREVRWKRRLREELIGSLAPRLPLEHLGIVGHAFDACLIPGDRK